MLTQLVILMESRSFGQEFITANSKLLATNQIHVRGSRLGELSKQQEAKYPSILFIVHFPDTLLPK